MKNLTTLAAALFALSSSPALAAWDELESEDLCSVWEAWELGTSVHISASKKNDPLGDTVYVSIYNDNWSIKKDDVISEEIKFQADGDGGWFSNTPIAMDHGLMIVTDREGVGFLRDAASVQVYKGKERIEGLNWGGFFLGLFKLDSCMDKIRAPLREQQRLDKLRKAGLSFGDAPLYEKFYVGDYTDLRPHRALDLAFDRRAAPNFLSTTIGEVRYGDYAARLNAEYRIPLYRGRKCIYGVDVFGSAGFYAVANGRDITTPPRGYHGFSNVPVDLTFNLGLKADTAAGGFSLGIANFIGFVPIRSGGQ